MTDAITAEIFDHLVHLAALELEPEEAEYLRRELNSQLNAIHELESIPLVADTQITSHGVPYTQETTPEVRGDEWLPFEASDEILEQAPEMEDGYIVVPDIPHTDLG
jgi:aspartyl-tRNA(Asn)/glutamyl-tRNA(Gln) amidotransferase subunit C